MRKTTEMMKKVVYLKGTTGIRQHLIQFLKMTATEAEKIRVLEATPMPSEKEGLPGCNSGELEAILS
jgi:hypothetical protein